MNEIVGKKIGNFTKQLIEADFFFYRGRYSGYLAVVFYKFHKAFAPFVYYLHSLLHLSVFHGSGA